jgi:hypothetical protein
MKTEAGTTVTNTKYSNKIELDKFYTRENVAIDCLSSLNLDEYDLVVEPSAGNGSFFRNIDHGNKVGLDLKPGCESIFQHDWFNYVIDKRFKRVLIIDASAKVQLPITC